MENLSLIEAILIFIASNTLSFLLAFFIRKIKIETLNKEITRLEIELMNSHSEVLRKMQKNVALEKIIKNLIANNQKRAVTQE
ncbi:hypothetical protein [Ferruginibacter sp.]|nr:hypothetical protein [Ferruginibacter sp.]